MTDVFTLGAAVVVAISAAGFYRIIAGRTVYDRLLAAGAVGTNAIVLLALTGFIFERPEAFVDLALAYALLNFIGAVAAGKYLERHPVEDA
ncbi:MAG: pH regulation protein F [Chloroflexi bacterium]|nr:pH regulation protein F [Chloroflexota bacterium]